MSAILGRNGAGKTTLRRTIIGFTPNRQGNILFKGMDIMHLSPYHIARSGIGLVPQRRRIFSSLTVKENLDISRSGQVSHCSAEDTLIDPWFTFYYTLCSISRVQSRAKNPSLDNTGETTAGGFMINEIPGDLVQWLREFYFVAERGGVRQAAAAMDREQPTITRQIKCLERELGVTLFDRSSGKMKITPEGKILLEKAISLFEDVKGITNEFRKQELGYEGKIIIATTHAIIDSFLPRYISHFRKIHPLVSFHLEGGIREMVFEKIESAEADLGIAFSESVPKTIMSYELSETGLVLIAPPKSPFFRRKTPTLKQIAAAPLILFSHRGLPERLIENRFAEENLKPNVVITHNNHVSVKRYVALGMGVAILSGHAVSEEDEKTIDIYPLDRYFPRRIIALLLRKRTSLPWSRPSFGR